MDNQDDEELYLKQQQDKLNEDKIKKIAEYHMHLIWKYSFFKYTKRSESI